MNEWDFQERAERGAPLPPSEAKRRDDAQAYRFIAESLREPSPSALPEDFVEKAARRVLTSRFERPWLEALVFAAFALGAGVVGWLWLDRLDAEASESLGHAANWLTARLGPVSLIAALFLIAAVLDRWWTGRRRTERQKPN